MGKYVYHYHATWQKTVGEIHNIDGLVVRESPFSGDWSEYESLKRQIADDVAGGDDAAELIICSLSLLSPNAQAQLPPEQPQAAEGTRSAPALWAVNCSDSLELTATDT